MNLYETIFKRRAVRKYNMAPLDAQTLNDIRMVLDSTDQLPGQRVRFEIVSSDNVKNAIAPHYILCHCSPGDISYANVGYTLQKADLYIQSLGFGSVWLGMAKPKQKEDDFCIMLAFGRSDVPFRTSEAEFKRLSITDISDTDNEIAHAARLAPSACNSQPWQLSFTDQSVTARYVGRGALKLILRPKMAKIDLGIITRHIVTALIHEGKTISAITPDYKNISIEITYQ